jgi:hypothetical protein
MPTLNVLLTKLQHINTNHIGGVIASVIALTHRGYELRLDQTKDYKIGLFCFFDKHAVFRSKSQEWLAQNQDNVSFNQTMMWFVISSTMAVYLFFIFK